MSHNRLTHLASHHSVGDELTEGLASFMSFSSTDSGEHISSNRLLLPAPAVGLGADYNGNGVPDSLERFGGQTAYGGSYRPAYSVQAPIRDTNFNGIPDRFEQQVNYSSYTRPTNVYGGGTYGDTNYNGIPDVLEGRGDYNYNGIPDVLEGGQTSYGTYRPSYVQPIGGTRPITTYLGGDSNYNGIPDVLEGGIGQTTTIGSYRPATTSYLGDSNFNGIPDVLESRPSYAGGYRPSYTPAHGLGQTTYGTTSYVGSAAPSVYTGGYRASYSNLTSNALGALGGSYAPPRQSYGAYSALAPTYTAPLNTGYSSFAPPALGAGGYRPSSYSPPRYSTSPVGGYYNTGYTTTPSYVGGGTLPSYGYAGTTQPSYAGGFAPSYVGGGQSLGQSLYSSALPVGNAYSTGYTGGYGSGSGYGSALPSYGSTALGGATGLAGATALGTGVGAFGAPTGGRPKTGGSSGGKKNSAVAPIAPPKRKKKAGSS